MHLYPILLIATVMAADSISPLGAGWNLSHAEVTAWSIGPAIAVLALTMLGMTLCERQLRRGRVPGPYLLSDRIARVARVLLILFHVTALLVFDWLGTVRAITGNLIFVDEFIAIMPALLGLIGIWWAYYPIDRRIHSAILIRQLDAGEAVYPMLNRFGYVLLQTRVHLLLTLVPVSMIAAFSEAIAFGATSLEVPPSNEWAVNIVRLAMAAGVFVFAPWVARMVLDVKPLAPGSMRDALLDVCKVHRVRVRELLVWQTNGTIFNAAVMGLFGPLRYVLMTDALLEAMPQEQVRAVMAHEIGHVRRRHMIWMVICLFASFGLAYLFLQPSVIMAESTGVFNTQAGVEQFLMSFQIAQLLIGLLLFAWVCRRFERQADTFAVQHLSTYSKSDISSGDALAQSSDQKVTANAVHTMCDALSNIAYLNAVDINRFSWRHGSIARRMDYLLSLTGQPLASLAIDRQIRRIKIFSAMILLGFMGYTIYLMIASGGQWQ